MTALRRDELASYLDFTLLKADATAADIDRVCTEAAALHTASVCVNPAWVARAHELLDGTGVRTCTVIGFPLGATTTSAKLQEARIALADGASELDMVINVGALKGGDVAFVESEVADLARLAHDEGALLKVIIETCLLTDDEKRATCRSARAAGADYVKTSTGFSTGGATVGDVRLMRETVGSEMGVKASGGIRTLDAALAMIEAGASRLGVSAAREILAEAEG